ncbi:MAG: hypothetical protein QM594_13730 [Niabella sp.]
MKRIIKVLLGLFLLLYGSACSKGDKLSPEELEHQRFAKYYVKFKVDGKQEEYKYLDEGQLGVAITTVADKNGNYGLMGWGYKTKELTNRNAVSWLIGHSAPVSANKVYGAPNSTVAGAIKAPVFWLSYQDNAGDSYVASIFDLLPGPYDAKVTLTHISDTEVKGSFSATLHNIKDGAIVKTVKLTDGEFFVPANY